MVDTTYIFLLVTSIVASIIGLIFTPVILDVLKTPEAVYQDAETYIRIMFLGMIPLFGYNGLAALMRGIGDSKTPLYLIIIATIINIVLDLLFVAVFKWGVAGASWATVIAQTVSFLAGVVLMQKKKSILRINILNPVFDTTLFWKSLKIGLPSGVQQMAVATGMMALTRIVNGFGDNAIAGFTAATRIDSLAMMPAMNFSMALSTFTGQNLGAGKFERVRKGLGRTIIMSVIVSIITTVFILLSGKLLVGLFTNDPEVIAIGYEFLLIESPFFVIFATMFMFTGFMRGLGDTFIPMIMTIMSLWLVRIPISAILSKYFGTAGIWWGIHCMDYGLNWYMDVLFNRKMEGNIVREFSE